MTDQDPFLFLEKELNLRKNYCLPPFERFIGLIITSQDQDKLSFNKLLKKFLSFVISKRRLFFIERIIEDFLDACSKNRGEIKADLSSSKELNETEILKIKDELASNFGANIKLNYKYDPSLIGGLIIKVESTMIDTSIKSKLKQLETKMVEA